MPIEVQCFDGDGIVDLLEVNCHRLRHTPTYTAMGRSGYVTQAKLDYDVFWLMDREYERLLSRQYITVLTFNVYTNDHTIWDDPDPPRSGLWFSKAMIKTIEREFSTIVLTIDHEMYNRHPRA